jgi:nitronate monooxygenase
MLMQTSLCRQLNIGVPIVQAPIGNIATPELAAAVSNAGALGMLSATWRDAEETRKVIRQTKALTDRPFGMNVCLNWDQTDRVKICLEEGVKIISLFWGDPTPYIDTVHEAGGLVMHTVASSEEARRVADAGVDIIVAQGWEAGGHVWGQVATLPLIPRIVDTVAPIPVIAAGGIADGRGIAAALSLGAGGVLMGTRFLLSEEAAAHPFYKDKLLKATESDTVYTSLFDIGWENAPHRTLRNSTIIEWETAGRPPSGERPNEGEIIAKSVDGQEIVRYSDESPKPGMTGDLEALALYAGQSAGLITEIKPAKKIVEDLIVETERTLRGVLSD